MNGSDKSIFFLNEPSFLKEFCDLIDTQLDFFIMIRLDKEYNILESNGAFLKFIEEKSIPKNQNFFNFFEAVKEDPILNDESLPSQLGKVYRLKGDTKILKIHELKNERSTLLIGERIHDSANDTIEVLSQFSNKISHLYRELSIKNKELEKSKIEIIELMRKDPLTKLANRRYMEEFLNQQVEYSKRYDTDLSVLFLDIDNFKKINDTFGHLVGDEVLKLFAKVFISESRIEDLACRYGGEEFCLILPHTNSYQAYSLGMRCKKALEAIIHPQIKHPVTASFGVASLSKNDTQSTLIDHADTALYRAKEQGKNRVIIYTP